MRARIGHSGDALQVFAWDNADASGKTILYLAVGSGGVSLRKSTDGGATYTNIFPA